MAGLSTHATLFSVIIEVVPSIWAGRFFCNPSLRIRAMDIQWEKRKREYMLAFSNKDSLSVCWYLGYLINNFPKNQIIFNQPELIHCSPLSWLPPESLVRSPWLPGWSRRYLVQFSSRKHGVTARLRFSTLQHRISWYHISMSQAAHLRLLTQARRNKLRLDSIGVQAHTLRCWEPQYCHCHHHFSRAPRLSQENLLSNFKHMIQWPSMFWKSKYSP